MVTRTADAAGRHTAASATLVGKVTTAADARRRMPGARLRGSGRVLLLGRLGVAGQDLGELVGAGDDGGRVQSPGLPRETLDRPRDRHGGDDATGGGADRGRDRSDAGL